MLEGIDNRFTKKEFFDWNILKTNLEIEGSFTDYYSEREIWWTSLGKNIGYEINGKHKEFQRPVLVFKKYNKDMCLVLPLTTKIKSVSFQFHFFFENKAVAAVFSQIKLLSTKRFIRKIGKIDSELYNRIKQGFIEHINKTAPT